MMITDEMIKWPRTCGGEGTLAPDYQLAQHILSWCDAFVCMCMYVCVQIFFWMLDVMWNHNQKITYFSLLTSHWHWVHILDSCWTSVEQSLCPAHLYQLVQNLISMSSMLISTESNHTQAWHKGQWTCDWLDHSGTVWKHLLECTENKQCK